MQVNEWKSIVLNQMGLIKPMSAHNICRQQNGVQAQFQGYADESFKSRMTRDEFTGDWHQSIVRQWSIRGTVHAYLKEEIPLYLYEGRNYCQPSLHLPTRDGKVSAATKQYYAQVILESLQSGNKEREELKEICRQQGMTLEQEKSLFNAWGGVIATLVSEGLIYQEYGRRVFGLLEDYQPLRQEVAELEIARRYFSGMGPVTLADARYYFKENKSLIESWMKQLDLNTVEVNGETRFYYGDLPEITAIPDVLLIAGFDALLLAFEKRFNPFFDAKYIRDIYTMTGIVKPTVMLRGELVATWRKEKGMIYLKPFKELNEADMQRIVSYIEEQQGHVLLET